MPLLRNRIGCDAFVEAIKEASRGLSWDRTGLVVTAALLQPVCAGEPAHKLVADYEDHQRLDAPKSAESWSGDVWAFTKWAQDNLPGFDPHHPNIGFLAH